MRFHQQRSQAFYIFKSVLAFRCAADKDCESGKRSITAVSPASSLISFRLKFVWDNLLRIQAADPGKPAECLSGGKGVFVTCLQQPDIHRSVPFNIDVIRRLSVRIFRTVFRKFLTGIYQLCPGLHLEADNQARGRIQRVSISRTYVQRADENSL